MYIYIWSNMLESVYYAYNVVTPPMLILSSFEHLNCFAYLARYKMSYRVIDNIHTSVLK